MLASEYYAGSGVGGNYMEKMKLTEAIVQLKNEKRKFIQSFDLVISLKNIDLKKPENRIQKEVILPHGRGKDIEIGIISESISGAMDKKFIESLTTPKEMKKIAKKYDFLLCEMPLMQLVGKTMGRYLAPVGKMPSPIPPQMKNIEQLVATKRNSVRIKVKDSPLIQIPVGIQSMADEHVKENTEKVLSELEKFLPKGKNQIRDIYLKLTMSKPVKIAW